MNTSILSSINVNQEAIIYDITQDGTHEPFISYEIFNSTLLLFFSLIFFFFNERGLELKLYSLLTLNFIFFMHLNC